MPLTSRMDHHLSSQLSLESSSDSNLKDICRICHCEGQHKSPLISPCYCLGSLRYVHNSCLQKWIVISDFTSCEICKFQFITHTKIKPFWKWKMMKMTLKETMFLLSIIYHIVAIPTIVTCLVKINSTACLYEQTSLSVLSLEKWFDWCWWKIMLIFTISIIFFVEMIFMFYQCQIYMQLLLRWRKFNRIIYVQDAPVRGAIVQHQNQEVLFSAASQLKDNVMIGETNHISLDIQEIHDFQIDSNSISNISNDCGSSVMVDNAESPCSERPTTEACYSETSSSFIPKSDNDPFTEYSHAFKETAIISTVADDNSSMDNLKHTSDKCLKSETSSTETSLTFASKRNFASVEKCNCFSNESVVIPVPAVDNGNIGNATGMSDKIPKIEKCLKNTLLATATDRELVTIAIFKQSPSEDIVLSTDNEIISNRVKKILNRIFSGSHNNVMVNKINYLLNKT